jgi:hypothetical protein
VAWAGLGLAGCVPPPATPAPVDPSRYADSALWLCLPGRTDACAGDLTATEIHPDGSRSIERFEPAPEPKADCFYVYPTVDLSLIPENHDDFSSLASMAAVTRAQAARFRESCALYVPLYRQVTIGTYLQSRERRERALAVAFADVDAAFEDYLRTKNRGRPIVLLGHSQGADMVVRLVRRYFDDDAELQKRLLLVLAIGGSVDAPAGQTVGGTFSHVPMCTGPDQTACVVAYRMHARDQPVRPPWSGAPDPGSESLCVNPADVEHNGLAPMAAAYIPIVSEYRRRMKGVDGIDTPFVVLKGFYAGQCLKTDAGYRFLAVSPANGAGDSRVSPIDLDQALFRNALGLHILDYQLPQGDLLKLVARRVAGLP